MKNLKLGSSMFFIGLLYCVLLAIGNLFIYEQQKKTIFSDFEARQAVELNLLSDLAQQGLMTQNYAFIEWYFKRWAREYNKVVSLSLESSQGYTVFSYQRPATSHAEQLVSSKKISMYDDTYLIKISAATIQLEKNLDELHLQLFLISTGATLLLIILLWLVFYRYAYLPLNREIKRRKKAEDELEAIRSET